MKGYVVDASVILKTLMKEDDSVSREFRKILKEGKFSKLELLSSVFLIIEVANGFRYGLESEKDSLEFFEKFLKLPIKFVELTKTQYKNAISLAHDTNTTVYDSSYHILAKAYGLVFLTCDRDYFKRAKSFGDIEFLD